MKKIEIQLGNSSQSVERLIYDFTSIADKDASFPDSGRLVCRLCKYSIYQPETHMRFCSPSKRTILVSGVKLKWYQKLFKKETPDTICNIPGTHKHFTCPNCYLRGIVQIKTIVD